MAAHVLRGVRCPSFVFRRLNALSSPTGSRVVPFLQAAQRRFPSAPVQQSDSLPFSGRLNALFHQGCPLVQRLKAPKRAQRAPVLWGTRNSTVESGRVSWRPGFALAGLCAKPAVSCYVTPQPNVTAPTSIPQHRALRVTCGIPVNLRLRSCKALSCIPQHPWDWHVIRSISFEGSCQHVSWRLGTVGVRSQ